MRRDSIVDYEMPLAEAMGELTGERIPLMLKLAARLRKPASAIFSGFDDSVASGSLASSWFVLIKEAEPKESSPVIAVAVVAIRSRGCLRWQDDQIYKSSSLNLVSPAGTSGRSSSGKRVVNWHTNTSFQRLSKSQTRSISPRQRIPKASVRTPPSASETDAPALDSPIMAAKTVPSIPGGQTDPAIVNTPAVIRGELIMSTIK